MLQLNIASSSMNTQRSLILLRSPGNLVSQIIYWRLHKNLHLSQIGWQKGPFLRSDIPVLFKGISWHVNGVWASTPTPTLQDESFLQEVAATHTHTCVRLHLLQYDTQILWTIYMDFIGIYSKLLIICKNTYKPICYLPQFHHCSLCIASQQWHTPPISTISVCDIISVNNTDNVLIL